MGLWIRCTTSSLTTAAGTPPSVNAISLWPVRYAASRSLATWRPGTQAGPLPVELSDAAAIGCTNAYGAGRGLLSVCLSICLPHQHLDRRTGSCSHPDYQTVYKGWLFGGHYSHQAQTGWWWLCFASAGPLLYSPCLRTSNTCNSIGINRPMRGCAAYPLCLTVSHSMSLPPAPPLSSFNR